MKILFQWHFKGALSRRFCCILVKTPQIFDKEPLSPNMKLLLERQEDNIKRFSQGSTSFYLATSPQYTERT